MLTNPPFGAIVKNDSILKRFELGSNRTTQRTETLFVERCLDLLKPGGRMGIVVPDGILTTISQQYVRDWINLKSRILAVISLPSCTFVPAGSGVKASLLFLEKKREAKPEQNYKIFMAVAEHVGYDATGRPDKNDLPRIIEKYKRFLTDKTIDEPPLGFVTDQENLEGRIDPYYYKPEFLTLDRILKSSSYPVKTLGEIMSLITGGATPTVKSDAYTDKENGIPFLRIQNINEDRIDLTCKIHNKRDT